jgi:coenzyme F420-reducing hydrogenase delta subunit
MSLHPVVFACERSALAGLPGLVTLPCTGRVSVPLLLGAVARGADGVLVLGRHQPTCRLRGAEEPTKERVRRAALALELVGLQGLQRLAFVEPAPGPDGPREAVAAFVERLSPSPLRDPPPEELLGAEGLDTALGLLRWLSRRPELTRDGQAWLERRGLPAAAPGGPALVAGDLPLLDLLAGELLRPLSLPDVAGAAVAVLTRLGAGGVGLRLGPPEEEEEEEAPLALDDVLRGWGSTLPRPGAPLEVAYLDGDPATRELIVALGHRPLDAGVDPLHASTSFSLSPGGRLAAERVLQFVADRGSRTLLVRDPVQLCRWAILTRQGTWRSSRPRPLLGIQLAARSLAPGRPS